MLVFYHGGVFVIESAFTPLYHAYLNGVAAKARVVAVSMEYRLASEHRLPTAYDDSWQALNWVARNAASGPEPWLRDRGNLSRLFVARDSTGANIAHHAVRRWTTAYVASSSSVPRSSPFRLAGVVLVQPYLGGEERTDAEARLDGKVPMVTVRGSD